MPLGQWPIRVGRSSECEINVDCDSISPVHCRVEDRAGRFWVVDLGSAGGISLNGRPVARRAALRPGDLIQVGTATLVFSAPGRGLPPDRGSATRPVVGALPRPQVAVESPRPVAVETPRQPRRIEVTPIASTRVRTTELQLVQRRGEQVCPLCRESSRAELCGHCRDCQTVYHQSCFWELGGCATLGCPSKGEISLQDDACWAGRGDDSFLHKLWGLLAVIMAVSAFTHVLISPDLVPAAALAVTAVLGLRLLIHWKRREPRSAWSDAETNSTPSFVLDDERR